MVQTVNQQEITDLLMKTTALYTYFRENKDIKTADKAKQLAKKLQEREFSIAFCGHFSAGKSSMINKLIGENLLPSSPIPTSANLVKVKSGDEYAKVYFKEGNPRVYPAPYNYEQVKTFCKDGDQIQSIEISHKTDSLPKEIVIMDTPGIDSTDDAHRIATESALHLADLVFYVMDYNHVQSELNFLFTKELTVAGKDVYLIINQIDKHREEELSFEHFKASVKDSFASWGVKPAQIFYTTLKVPNHSHNQFEQLNSFIHSKIDSRDQLLTHSVYYSLKKLAEEHQEYLKENEAEKLASSEEILSSLPLNEQQQLPNKVKEIQSKLEELSAAFHEKDLGLTKEIDVVLKNAYLMPFQTRELAEQYLQARQPDFKIGLFFSKQKTLQERKERLNRLYEDFSERVKSQLEWHLKELLLNILKQEEIHDSNLLIKVQNLTVPFTPDMLEQTVKEGARLSGEYVLNYTNDLVEAIKKIAREKVYEIKEDFLSLFKNKSDHLQKQLEAELKMHTLLLEAWENKQLILENQTLSKIKMEQYLTGNVELEVFKKEAEILLADEPEVEIIYNSANEWNTVESTSTETNLKMEEEPFEVRDNDPQQIDKLVYKLKNSAHDLKEVPGFKRVTAELIQKAERLENRGFTVALFGAFSAGKSSFANALIGEKLLPVSPNPTTAAINKIMPVDDLNPHGTVKVKLKDTKVLFEDVSRSLEVFQLSITDFDQALSQIKHVIENVEDFNSYEKTHFAFLQAFYKGFGSYRDQLGEAILVDLNEFKEFVANEEKSCLVETIEVYFDCELTRKGITLVDTPGADSINARHTGVAFEYIKNSDAILFVTYYNHAFSKADREFLIQLGRVKDAFELDKMFFIVNAIDLANSEDEMNEVMHYVEDQLIKYGIRRPSLFAISSLLAIEEKLAKSLTPASGISQFEQKFYSFITHDLTDIAVNVAKAEWERAIELLRNYIHSSQADIEQKEQRKVSLTLEQKEIQSTVQQESLQVWLPRLTQETDELTYYIKQRVFYRFNDMFKESFNPSVLKDDGRNLKKALNHAMDDFLGSFGFDFAQELRATTVRLEAFVNKLIQESQHAIAHRAIEKNGELSFTQYEPGAFEGIPFDSAFKELNRDMLKKPLSLFRNPKSFFENNEKKLMMEALEKILQEPAEDYLQRENSRLKSYYEKQLLSEFDGLINHLLEEINEYYEGMFAALSNEIPVEKLQQIEKKLSSY